MAGEAMDDLLRAGSLGNLDDGFPTLENDSGTEGPLYRRNKAPEIDPALLAEDALEFAGTQGTAAHADDTNSQATVSDTQSMADGDVEDNAPKIEVIKEKLGTSSSRSRKPGKAVVVVKSTRKNVKPTTPNRKNGIVKSATPSNGRYSTRHQEKLEETVKEEERLAKRPSTRALTKNKKAVEIQKSNRDKMTARAATLYKKAKKKAVKVLPEHRDERRLIQGMTRDRSVAVLKDREVNLIGKYQGYVLVMIDEVEVEEYVRY